MNIFINTSIFFTKLNVFRLILKLTFVEIIFTEYIFAYFYVFNHFFIGYVWILKKAVWTGLDRFLVVQSSFFGSCHNRQPVAVVVRPNQAKKPHYFTLSHIVRAVRVLSKESEQSLNSPSVVRAVLPKQYFIFCSDFAQTLLGLCSDFGSTY